MVIVDGEGKTGLSRDWPRKRLRWDLVRAYSEAGRNRGILNTVKKECKRRRARATRQLSMLACRHCSQHCINVNPMTRKVLWWESELFHCQMRKHSRETKSSGPMQVDDRKWAPKQAFSVQNEFCQSQRSDLWVTDMREWKQLLNTGSEPEPRQDTQTLV